MSNTPPTPDEAAEAGFPVAVDMPLGDGPLIVSDVSAGTTETYDVVDGVAHASTRARLATLVRLGGVPTITPPD